jgi:hypothetical protein
MASRCAAAPTCLLHPPLLFHIRLFWPLPLLADAFWLAALSCWQVSKNANEGGDYATVLGTLCLSSGHHTWNVYINHVEDSNLFIGGLGLRVRVRYINHMEDSQPLYWWVQLHILASLAMPAVLACGGAARLGTNSCAQNRQRVGAESKCLCAIAAGVTVGGHDLNADPQEMKLRTYYLSNGTIRVAGACSPAHPQEAHTFLTHSCVCSSCLLPFSALTWAPLRALALLPCCCTHTAPCLAGKLITRCAEPYAEGDLVSLQLDMDSRSVQFLKNGVIQGTGDSLPGARVCLLDIATAVYCYRYCWGTLTQ